MIRPSIDRFALSAGVRTLIRPTDLFSWRHVRVGNVSNGILQVDFGDPTRYAVIGPSGFEDYFFPWPDSRGLTETVDLNNNIYFYATMAQNGTLNCEWTGWQG